MPEADLALIRDAGRVLLEAAPADLDVEAVSRPLFTLRLQHGDGDAVGTDGTERGSAAHDEAAYGIDQRVDLGARHGGDLAGQARLVEEDDRVVLPANGLDLGGHDQKASVGV